MWEKIVLNLISNAFKFTFDGQIRVSTRLQDGAALLIVEDTGVGIDRQELPRLFERFYRGRQARLATFGTGMGLAITRGLLSAAGGRIWAENASGAGATFSLAVPGAVRAATVGAEPR